MPPADRRKREASPKSSTSSPTAKRPNTTRRTSVIVLTKDLPVPDNPPIRTPASLTALPDELLLKILEYWDAQLDEWDTYQRQKLFRDVCLVSRRLNRLGNDFLYRNFESGRSHANTAKFLRTIIANPALASRVKQIRWEFGDLTDSYTPTSTDCRLLQESLKTLYIPNQGVWVNQYCSGQAADMLRILLLHTPNIRELYMMDFETESPRWECFHESVAQLLFGGVNGNLIGLAPTYAQLQTLTLMMGNMSLEQICPAFYLPSLKMLSLVGGHRATIHANESAPDEPTPNSSITTLRILKSHMGSTAVSQLISRCGALKHVEFEFFYCNNTHRKLPEGLSYRTIAEALQQHKKTLEIIKLNDVSEWDEVDFFDYDRGKIGSFRDFDNLEFLSAPMEVFEPTEDNTNDDDHDHDQYDYLHHAKFATVLPNSLKHLSLIIFEDEEQTHFCSKSLSVLHGIFRNALPNLRNITINAHKEVDLYCIDIHYPKFNFGRSGVEFNLIKDGINQSHVKFSDEFDTLTDEGMSTLGSFTDEDIEGLFYDEIFGPGLLGENGEGGEDGGGNEGDVDGEDNEGGVDTDNFESLVLSMIQEGLAGTEHSMAG